MCAPGDRYAGHCYLLLYTGTVCILDVCSSWFVLKVTAVQVHAWQLYVQSFQQHGGVQGERALQMDVQEGARLQLQAFEAINEVVRSASPDTLPLVGQLIQALLDKLASTLRMQVTSSEAKEHQKDLQVWLSNTRMLQS